jgi:hypothetical protein
LVRDKDVLPEQTGHMYRKRKSKSVDVEAIKEDVASSILSAYAYMKFIPWYA